MARRDGQIIARGERRWLVRWHQGCGPNGRRVYRSKMVHGTKRDAQKKLNSVLRSRDLGTYVEPTKMTLCAYLERWLEDAAKRSLRRRTFDDYKSLLERDLVTLEDALSAADSPDELKLELRGISKGSHRQFGGR